jgi:hypothetical protein
VDGKIHVEYILHPKLVMNPHSFRGLRKEVFPEYGWEETGWHHESWQWQGNWSMDGALLELRKLPTSQEQRQNGSKCHL